MHLCDAGCSAHTLSFSALCDVMLAILVCATRWLSMQLYMLAYMSMHESCLLVCRPYFNTMKLWTSDPILHLSPVDTTFCLPFCLFVFLLVCLLAYLLSCFLICLFILWLVMSPAICYACHVYHAYLFYASFTCFLHFFPSIACLLVSWLCICMYTHGARKHGARAQAPRRKQKRRGCKHVDISQLAIFSWFRGLAFPIWLCTLLNPLPSFLLSFLDGLY